MRLFRRLLMFLLLVSVVVAAGWCILDWQCQKPGPLTSDIVVDIPQGASNKKIANLLSSHYVIGHPFWFYLRLYGFEKNQTLKAGEYQFSAGISLKQTIEKLRNGDVVMRMLTIPEGWTSQQASQFLNDHDDLSGTMITNLVEGTILPETYHYHKGEPRQSVVTRMVSQQKSAFEKLWAQRPRHFPLRSMEEAIILASMIEKESGKKSERARIAGVFFNRLRLGMRLQSDPTVIYGITLGRSDLERPLTWDDLQHPSGFNTYVIKGLPPKPICNPGIHAFQAVLNPEPTQDLYFVADGEGGHRFAKTLSEHNKNVAKLRRLRTKP